jgi:hypothetical protein
MVVDKLGDGHANQSMPKRSTRLSLPKSTVQSMLKQIHSKPNKCKEIGDGIGIIVLNLKVAHLQIQNYDAQNYDGILPNNLPPKNLVPRKNLPNQLPAYSYDRCTSIPLKRVTISLVSIFGVRDWGKTHLRILQTTCCLPVSFWIIRMGFTTYSTWKNQAIGIWTR